MIIQRRKMRTLILLMIGAIPFVICIGAEASVVYLGTFGGHQYYYDTGSFTSFDDARQAAQAVPNRDLVSITSEAENNFLATAIAAMPNAGSNLRAAWIGLFRTTTSDPWVWVSGAAASYLNWRPAGVGHSWAEPTGETAGTMYINGENSIPLGLWGDTYRSGGESFNAIYEVAPVPIPGVYAAFPGFGLWKHDGTSWSRLTIDMPENMVASGSVLYSDFGAIGLWKWDGSNWSQLTSDNPQTLAVTGSTLYAGFGGYGLWKWDGTSWSRLTSDNPENIVASGSTVYGDFGALGLWKHDGTSWSRLTPDNPQNMAVSGSTLYVDFGTLGLWRWNGSSWSQLTSDNPENIAASGSTLYGDFGAQGLWKWNGSSWTLLTPDNPENIAASGSNLYGDFGTIGLWKWDGTKWNWLTSDNPTLLITN